MPVYVDRLFVAAEPKDPRTLAHHRRNGGRWCHLTADTVDELQRFAVQIGLNPAWYQPPRGRQRVGHYDLTPRVRRIAVTAGAVQVDPRQISVIMRGRPLSEAQPPGLHFAEDAPERAETLFDVADACNAAKAPRITAPCQCGPCPQEEPMPVTLTLAPAVAEATKKLIWHEHSQLADAAILCLFSDAKAPDEPGVDAVVKAKIASPEVRAASTLLGGSARPVDLLLLVNEAAWNELRPEVRAAYLDHALSHLRVKIGDDGHTSYKLRDHDLGEFGDVAARHGSALPGLGEFAAALDETGREIMLPNGRTLVLHDTDDEDDDSPPYVAQRASPRPEDDHTIQVTDTRTGEMRLLDWGS